MIAGDWGDGLRGLALPVFGDGGAIRNGDLSFSLPLRERDLDIGLLCASSPATFPTNRASTSPM